MPYPKTRGGGLRVKPRLATPKMFATGKKRCPVALLKKYLDKRPLIAHGPMRLQIQSKITTVDSIELYIIYNRRYKYHNICVCIERKIKMLLQSHKMKPVFISFSFFQRSESTR